MINACRVLFLQIFFFIHSCYWLHIWIIYLSFSTATICKCSGNSYCSNGIQSVCILYTFSFHTFRHNRICSHKRNFIDDLANFFYYFRLHFVFYHKINSIFLSRMCLR